MEKCGVWMVWGRRGGEVSGVCYGLVGEGVVGGVVG